MTTARMSSPPPIQHPPDRARRTAYVLVALAGLLAGLILGAACGVSSGGSRVGWPVPTNPRALSP